MIHLTIHVFYNLYKIIIISDTSYDTSYDAHILQFVQNKYNKLYIFTIHHTIHHTIHIFYNLYKIIIISDTSLRYIFMIHFMIHIFYNLYKILIISDTFYDTFYDTSYDTFYDTHILQFVQNNYNK